jgi:hypothetical protein
MNMMLICILNVDSGSLGIRPSLALWSRWQRYPSAFWELLLSPDVMSPVYASLAEVSSMSSTAGG